MSLKSIAFSAIAVAGVSAKKHFYAKQCLSEAPTTGRRAFSYEAEDYE